MSVAVVLAPSALPLEHTIVKKERINPTYLTQLLSHPDLSDETRTALRAYQKRVKDGRVEVQYTLGYKVKASEEFSGRYYAKGGNTLQGFKRDVRNLLAGGFYYDVDFKNAQPTLLLQKAEKHGLVCRTLREFCEERDRLLPTFSDDRDTAKQMAMKALYGGSTEGMPPFLQRLGEEARMMGSVISTLYREQVPPTLRKNSPSSILSHLLQTEEKKCLLEMEKALARRGWTMDALIHDGGLVARREDAVLTDAILREVEKDITTATGYTLELAIKPMVSTITLESVVDDYPAMKAEFEKTHFKVMNPYQFIRIWGEDIQVITQTDLRGCYQNKFLRNGKSFIERWLADPTMLTYDRMVFVPMGEAPEGCYNTFHGWKVKPVAGGDTFAVHALLDLMANHDPKVKEYLLNYHASIVQKPHEKTGICIVYASESHGTGKDTWTNFFSWLLGSRYVSNTGDPSNQWFGRFNAHMEYCVYAKCEELSFADSKQHSNRFKSNITATEITYENKGVKPYNAPSYTNYAATTNNLCAVLLEDKERRFVLINPSNERMGQHQFWDAMYAELKKPEVQSAFMNELMTRDLTNFNPRADRPITELYEEVATQQAPFHAKFFQFLLEAEMLPAQATGMELTRRMNDYLKQYVPNYPARSPQAVGKALLKYVDAGAVEKHRHGYGMLYTLDAEKIHAYLVEKKWWTEV